MNKNSVVARSSCDQNRIVFLMHDHLPRATTTDNGISTTSTRSDYNSASTLSTAIETGKLQTKAIGANGHQKNRRHTSCVYFSFKSSANFKFSIKFSTVNKPNIGHDCGFACKE